MPVTALILSHRHMRSARHAGQARPLSAAITDFTRYRGTCWWATSAVGWLRITGTHLASCLDSASARLDTQNADRLRSGQQGE